MSEQCTVRSSIIQLLIKRRMSWWDTQGEMQSWILHVRVVVYCQKLQAISRSNFWFVWSRMHNLHIDVISARCKVSLLHAHLQILTTINIWWQGRLMTQTAFWCRPQNKWTMIWITSHHLLGFNLNIETLLLPNGLSFHYNTIPTQLPLSPPSSKFHSEQHNDCTSKQG